MRLVRRALAIAVLTLGTGAALAPVRPASACDPNTFPNCQTHCGAVASRYRWIQDHSSIQLPDWPSTGVAGCP